MQATVSAFDGATFSGRVLLDDGVELEFSAEALAGTGLRFLRPGQRVRLRTTGDGASLKVDALQVITLA
jgi:2-phospho-L-lactate guanylyltransferase